MKTGRQSCIARSYRHTLSTEVSIMRVMYPNLALSTKVSIIYLPWPVFFLKRKGRLWRKHRSRVLRLLMPRAVRERQLKNEELFCLVAFCATFMPPSNYPTSNSYHARWVLRSLIVSLHYDSDGKICLGLRTAPLVKSLTEFFVKWNIKTLLS